MIKKSTKFLSSLIAIIGFSVAANAQCPGGQAEVTVEVTTDSWGYECYWEYTPTGNLCGAGTLGAYGNAGVVGCAGGQGQVATAGDAGAYANSTTITENLGCLAIGSCFDLHYVDDWGDGGATFEVFIDGISAYTFTPGGVANATFTFCVTAAAAYDVAMSNPDEEYTLVPLEQVTALGANGLISNVGTGTVTNASMTVNVYDGLMANVYSGTSNIVASIASAASAPVTAAGYTPTVVDVYTVELISSITELDGDLNNDTSYVYYSVTDSTYARDNGTISNLLGVGAGTAAVIGQNYELVATDTMTSVSFFVAPGAPGLGDSVSISIYNTAGGTPTTIIGESDIYLLTTADTVSTGAFITLNVTDLLSAPLILGAGTYYVAANEYNTVDNMAIALTDDIYTPNTAWISIAGGAFATSEGLGFPGAYVIRPNFGPYVCAATGSTVTDAACNTYTWAQNGSTYTTTGMYNDTLVNAMGCDSIITLDLTINVPTTSTEVASSCSDFVWAVDGQTYTTTGMYTAVIPNAAGCDSTITLDLTIGALDLTTSTATFTITANGTAAAYQWIDCGNGNAIIAGENGQSFTATANGDYAVILTDGSCVDTSACVTITGVGLNENDLSSSIEIFPNPSNGEFTIAVSGIAADKVTVVITEANGKIIMTEDLTNTSDSIVLPVDVNSIENGVYFVTISANDFKSVQRIVVSK